MESGVTSQVSVLERPRLAEGTRANRRSRHEMAENFGVFQHPAKPTIWQGAKHITTPARIFYFSKNTFAVAVSARHSPNLSVGSVTHVTMCIDSNCRHDP